MLLTVRPQAPLQLLFTGHYDTVFGADHPFQALRFLDNGWLNGWGWTMASPKKYCTAMALIRWMRAI